MASSTPWTAEDLRRNSSSWTLEGDAKLLEYMQTISRNLEKRAENTNSMLHDMVLNTQETSVSLENITNKLSALQHSQFVENRVYEDDETITNKSKILINDQQGKDEYDPIKTLNTVLQNSISMMNKCYQRVSIDIEDSDDEEGLSKRYLTGAVSCNFVSKIRNKLVFSFDKQYVRKTPIVTALFSLENQTELYKPAPKLHNFFWLLNNSIFSIVYKPKNFFDQKPLPYLIGSKEWREKWHVGLCDTDEDYSDDENKEEYSDTSENISISASLPSNAPTISESENSVWGLHPSTNSKRPAMYSPSSDEEVSSNSMTSKTSSEKINKKINSDKEIIPPTYMLPPQEQKYYIHKPKEKGLFDESSDESDEGDLSSKSQIQAKKQAPYKFANGVSNIFSDEPPELDEVDRNNENENNQLFYEADEDIVNKNQTQNVDRSKEEKLSNIRKKPVNLFDDEDFESFMEELDKKANEKLCQIKKEKNATNLFDNINQDEPKETIVSHKSVDKQIEIPAAERKTEIEIMKKSPFESDTEDNIFENITNKKKITETNPSQRIRNLFDDESDDEFESVFRKQSEIEAKISHEKTHGTTESDTRKFEGGSAQNKTESENHTFINALKNQKTNINLFENKNVPRLFPLEEPEDDDLFSEIKKPSESVASSLVGKERQKEESIVKLNVEDLFSNSDDDIFSSKKLPPIPQPRSGIAITPKDGLPSRDVLKTSIENEQPYETAATGGNTTVIGNKTTLSTSNKQNISKNQFDNSDSDKSKLHSTVKTPKTTASGVSSTKNEKEQITHKNILSSIFFDDKPPNDDDDDDDDIFNIPSQKKSELDVSVPNSSSKLVKNDGISSELCPDYNKKNHSISFDGSNESASEESVLEKSEETGVLNKFKLPSLFDDVTVEDEDFLFSKSIIATQKSVSSTSCEHISDNDNKEYKIIEENKLESCNEKELIVTVLVEDEINNRIVQEELENSGDKNTIANENTSLKLEDSENAFQQGKELENSINKDLFEPKSSGNFSKPDESPNISTVENNIHKDNLNNSQAREFDINLKSDIADNYDKKQEDEGIAIVKETEQIDNSKTSASIFSTINLLQDIPPEDDFHNSTDSKRLHNIFYDDFAETIPSTKNHPRKQSINFFFSDEPPPDSFDDDTISEPENEKSSTRINDTLISKTYNEPNITSPVIEKEANISESDQTEPDNSILSVSELIKKVGTEQTYSKSKTNTSIPKKLNRNLDINVAALIPGAKRPNIKTNEDFKVNTIVDDKESSSLMSKRVEASAEDQSCITPKPNTSKDVFDPNRLQSLNKTRAKIQVKRHPSTRKGRQESLKKSLSLDTTYADSSTNDITDADDTKSDTEEAELFSETINHESNESTMNFTANNLNVNSQIISTQQNSDSLGDFNQSLDDDWLTRSIQIEKSNNPIEINQKTSENSIKSINKSIAVEESDDDDDLFASALKTTASKVSQPPPSYMEEKPKVVQKQDIKTNTKTNTSIFHDDSDDGLFGNAQKQKTTDTLNTLAKEKVIEKAKIFSSDEDDDDIFSKSFKTDKKLENNAPKKLAVPISQSLFGDDDDDDDDLFGPTTTKTKSKVTHTFKAPKKQEKKSPVGSITDDNPLADLLNG